MPTTGHTHFISWHTYTYTTPTSCPYHFWIACYYIGGLQVAVISSYFWNMYKIMYCTESAMCLSGCNSPVIAWTFSKCGVWESGSIVNTAKSKLFAHCQTHFLTHPCKQHNYILMYHFWFECCRLGRLQLAIVFKLYLKHAQNGVWESDCGECLGP